MNTAQPKNYWVILVTLAMAMLLAIMPLPEVLNWMRPEWMVIVLVYWIVALPHRVGVTTAWLAGLMMDALTGTLLGLQALATAVVAYLAILLYQRMRMFPVWKQAFVVFLLTGIYLLIVLWLRSLVEPVPRYWYYWSPAFVSALLWPAAYVILRVVRRRFHVS